MTDQTVMTMTLPDGTTTPPFTAQDLRRVIDEIKEARDAKRGSKGTSPLKHDPDFAKAEAHAYSVTADELRQFIERLEQLAAEKADIAEQAKEVMSEAKGRGYDTKIIRKIIALRKRKPGEIAEEEAILEMYKAALGMK
jgi:uncharacterized protein (UPF0335 family)